MATTRKQDKASANPAQATPPSENVASGTASDAGAIPGAAADSTDPGSNGDGGSAGQGDALALANAAPASAPAAPSAPEVQSTQDDGLAGLAHTEGPADIAEDLNPAQVEVYPLRSFMDEGELRRRGGPSYWVPRRHAEELERRRLISRDPLEE